MNTKLKAGVIGLGVGEQHALAFQSIEECELIAICDKNADKLKEVSNRINAKYLYLNSKELIENPDIDVVCIASNDDDHHQQILACIENNKHIFCEKPLCLNSNELEDIFSAWKSKKDLKISTNTILRQSPRFKWLKNTIRNKELGSIYSIEAEYSYGRLNKLINGWRGDIKNYSVMLGGGIHMVDLVSWLHGKYPTEVTAYSNSIASAGSKFDSFDFTTALLKFADNSIAKISANFACVHPHYHRLLIYGTEGTFENTVNLSGEPAKLWKTREENKIPELINEDYPAVNKGGMIKAFVQAILDDTEPEVSAKETFDAVSICLAIDESVKTQKPVKVRYNAL